MAKVIAESGQGTRRTLFEGTRRQCLDLFGEELKQGYWMDENDFEWILTLEHGKS